MNAGQHIDVKFMICGAFGDILGFPQKYGTSDKSWTIADREFIKNGLVVSVIRDGCVLRMEVTNA